MGLLLTPLSFVESTFNVIEPSPGERYENFGSDEVANSSPINLEFWEVLNLSLAIFPALCCLLTASSTLVSMATLLATLLIGVDQYLAIVAPLHYHHRVNRCKHNHQNCAKVVPNI